MEARYVNAIVRATKGILMNHLGAEVHSLTPKLEMQASRVMTFL
ncbi:hypothetical protein [Alkalicoccobacillus plakortidis]|nr:hypothetical protein [Alkalicoccobacillus plakortidis]